jgi:glycosyltransferase involved in cell wall biosynthesis
MPVFQGERFLEEALQSIADQDTSFLDQLEILAVDDGSTDRSVDLIQAWSSRLPLTLLRREEGSNWMAATNVGLAAAKGEWISFLHQDDSWLPGRLETLSTAIHDHPQITFFCHPVEFRNPSGKRVGIWSPPWPAGRPLPLSELLPHYASQNNLAIPAPCFHRSLLETTGLLREDLWFLADWDFWLRLLSVAGAAYCLPETLATFRLHPDSQTQLRSGNADDLRGQFREIRTLIETLSPQGHPRESASRVNEDLTVTLSAWNHKQRGCFWKTLGGFLSLGPKDLLRFPREVRLGQRILPRLRIHL